MRPPILSGKTAFGNFIQQVRNPLIYANIPIIMEGVMIPNLYHRWFYLNTTLSTCSEDEHFIT